MLVALNSGGTQNFRVSYGGQTFGYSLPGGAMATFSWPGTLDPIRTGPITGLGGKCLDVTNGSTANGNQPQLWTCYSGSANQTWTLAADGTVRGLGKCLDVTGNGTADCTPVQLWDCFGGGNQRWTVSNGTLVNVGSGRCLDVIGNSTADGAKLQIWSCTGGANQRWTVPV